MTGAEVRALCRSLPDVTETLTWGDAEHDGHPTFRVNDRIFVIMAEDESGGSIRTSAAEQGELIAAFPDAVRSAAYVGRFGWVEVDFGGLPDEVLREIVGAAWARTAPKRLAATWSGWT